jgi:enterochelin esterase-like enzyme
MLQPRPISGDYRQRLRGLVAAALFLVACQASPSEPARSESGTSGAQPGATAQVSAPPLPAPRPPPTTPTPPARGPNAPAALQEYVGSLWGSFHEERFYSDALDREMPYYIYLPPAHGTAEHRFPVLYMLHGASGDNAEWGTIRIIDWTDQLIASGEIPPLIVVLPQGDFGYWVNHVNGGARWGDYVVEDLVLHLDQNYRTLPAPRARAVGGLSQGGHAAFQLTFNHPDIFGIAGAHSPSLRADDGFLPWLGTGPEFARRDPISLADSLPLATLQRATLWLDVGSEDQWRPRVELLHDTLTARGVAHEFHVWPGAHDGDYWQPHVPDYLRYYGRALRNAARGS